MNRRRLSRLAALILALALPLLLAGCGNKGPLVLPGQPKTDTVAADETPEAEAEAPTTPSEPPPQRDR